MLRYLQPDDDLWTSNLHRTLVFPGPRWMHTSLSSARLGMCIYNIISLSLCYIHTMPCPGAPTGWPRAGPAGTPSSGPAGRSSSSSARCFAVDIAPAGSSTTFLDVCASSLRMGQANLLCFVPIFTDDPRRESVPAGSLIQGVMITGIRTGPPKRAPKLIFV